MDSVGKSFKVGLLAGSFLDKVGKIGQKYYSETAKWPDGDNCEKRQQTTPGFSMMIFK